VAREVVWQKFSKLPQLAKVLLGTGDRIIAEATRNDRIWGAFSTTRIYFAPFYTHNGSCCQDRLGTNIGKAFKKEIMCAFAGIGLDVGERDVGVPANWRGTNVLGWALMQARDRLYEAEGEAARVAAEEQAKTTKKKKKKSGPSLRRQQR
jgi:predicted NAD-dependent protein-ADP-ribosyltransferase YbiA (DUF1768 family)